MTEEEGPKELVTFRLRKKETENKNDRKRKKVRKEFYRINQEEGQPEHEKEQREVDRKNGWQRRNEWEEWSKKKDTNYKSEETEKVNRASVKTGHM